LLRLQLSSSVCLAPQFMSPERSLFKATRFRMSRIFLLLRCETFGLQTVPLCLPLLDFGFDCCRTTLDSINYTKCVACGLADHIHNGVPREVLVHDQSKS